MTFVEYPDIRTEGSSLAVDAEELRFRIYVWGEQYNEIRLSREEAAKLIQALSDAISKGS